MLTGDCIFARHKNKAEKLNENKKREM
jgi:hypothetical protein